MDEIELKINEDVQVQLVGCEYEASSSKHQHSQNESAHVNFPFGFFSETISPIMKIFYSKKPTRVKENFLRVGGKVGGVTPSHLSLTDPHEPAEDGNIRVRIGEDSSPAVISVLADNVTILVKTLPLDDFVQLGLSGVGLDVLGVDGYAVLHDLFPLSAGGDRPHP